MVLRLMADGDEGAAATMLARRAEEPAHEDPVAGVLADLRPDVVAQGDLAFEGRIDDVAHPLMQIAHHVGHAIAADALRVRTGPCEKAGLLVDARIVEVLIVLPSPWIVSMDTREQVGFARVACTGGHCRAVRIQEPTWSSTGAIPLGKGAKTLARSLAGGLCRDPVDVCLWNEVGF